MLAARQFLLMRRARDRAILIAIAPLGAVVLLPDPDFRRRIFRCVSHVGLAFVALRLAEMDRWNTNNAQRLGAELHDCLGSEADIRPKATSESADTWDGWGGDSQRDNGGAKLRYPPP